MMSRVWNRCETPYGVDLSKNFGVSSCLDLFGEGNDVLEMLTIICATADVEIKIEPQNYCSLRAARIQRSDFDALFVTYRCASHAFMHRCNLCIYASM